MKTIRNWLNRTKCWLFGHIPTGPICDAPFEHPTLDRPIYECCLCHRLIRFNRVYPNGWVLDPPLTDAEVDSFLAQTSEIKVPR